MDRRVTIGGLSLLLLGASPAHQSPALKELAWLAGTREVTTGAIRVEERWTEPATNLMLGLSRTVKGDRVVEFEFLRIEARPDGLYYVAQPGGRPPTSFKLVTWDGKEAVFANPEHDFPKRIIYRRAEGGAVIARIDGGAEVTKGAQEWLMKPAW